MTETAKISDAEQAARVPGLEAKIAATDAELVQVCGKLRSLEARAATRASEEQLQSKILALEEMLLDKDAEVRSIEHQASGQVRRAMAQAAQLQAEVSEKDSTIADLHQRLELVRADLTATTDAQGELGRANEALERQLAGMCLLDIMTNG